MTCMKCNRNLAWCICDDINQRLEALRNATHVHIDVDTILAARHLNKFDIERDRKEQQEKEVQ